MTKEAIVLAGGFGTRLQTVVSDVPKPMAQVNGKAFLDYILYLLAKSGVERAIFALGHKHWVIEEYLNNPHNCYGLEISFSLEESPLGTGGAIFQAFKQVQGDAAFVLNGDTYFDVPLMDLEEFAMANSAGCAFALKLVENSSRYGTVEISEDGEILSFVEKDSDSEHAAAINGGVYYIRKSIIEDADKPAQFSMETDFFQKDLKVIKPFGKVYEGIFIDIGTPEDYKLAQSLLALR